MITGQAFQPPPCLFDVTFGGISSPAYTFVSASEILATIPAGASGAADVRVHISGGGTTTPFPYTVGPCGGLFERGDCNDDGNFDIADPVSVLAFLFPVGPPAPVVCEDACDANDDASFDLSDVYTMLDYLYGSGDPLPEPFGECGTDETDDSFDCDDPDVCD